MLNISFLFNELDEPACKHPSDPPTAEQRFCIQYLNKDKTRAVVVIGKVLFYFEKHGGGFLLIDRNDLAFRNKDKTGKTLHEILTQIHHYELKHTIKSHVLCREVNTPDFGVQIYTNCMVNLAKFRVH